MGGDQLECGWEIEREGSYTYKLYNIFDDLLNECQKALECHVVFVFLSAAVKVLLAPWSTARAVRVNCFILWSVKWEESHTGC